MNKTLLCLLLLLLFIPVFLLRDYTPNNELRYVSIINESLENGSLFTFYNHGIPYADKPPLYLWIMMIGNIIADEYLLFFMGFINLAAVSVIIYVMTLWTFPEKRNFTQILAPMLALVSTAMFTASFIVVRMDILMTMFITLSLHSFFKIYTGKNRKSELYLFPVYLFLGVFAKGPVGLAVPVISIVVFLLLKNDLKKIFRFFGFRTIIIFTILALIWFSGVYLEGGITYLKNMLFNQTIDRAVDSFHHKEPIYYYMIRIWMMASPWILFCAVMIFLSLKKHITRNNDTLYFYLVIIASTFLSLSFVSSKIDIYLLPIYPFLIYFSFGVLERVKVNRWIKASLIIPYVALACAIPSIFILIKKMELSINSYFLLFLGIAAIFIGLIFGFKYLFKSEIKKSIIAVTLSMLIFVFLNSFNIPSFNNYLGYKVISQHGVELSRKHNITTFASYNMGRAENMDVYLNNNISVFINMDILKNSVSPPLILFTRSKTSKNDKELQKLTENCEKISDGKYDVYVIK